MSLILDALRKSEAERRRGQVPDLHAELPPPVRAAAPARRAGYWWIGAAFLAAVALWSAARWWPASSPSSDSMPVREAPATPALSASPSEEPQSGGLDVAPPRPFPQTSALPTAVSSQQPAATATATSTAPARSTSEAAPPAPPAAQAETRPVVRRDVPDSAPDAASQPVAEREIPTPPAATMRPAPAPISSPSPEPTLSSPTDTVRLADLTPGEREQLPPLKISMHMWGPTPAQRFAIVDGARIGAGDRIGEAVVDEVTSDGVILSWHGRRVSVPVR